ncbi:YxiG-like protein [Nonomuraea wenchangensis]|uniref:YxiG-like protein n=1 Tax=Nonomuraea wenchangensis TaxID=568860 RepID=UPI00332335C7
MDPDELQQALDEVFDQALLHHGFVDYMRDYQLVIHATADPRTGIAPTTLRYLFRHCVQAHCTTTVPPGTWRDSLDDRLITYETGVNLDGYVWGVNWQMLYPGATLITDSPAARDWAAAIGIDFHEVRIQTNAHDLALIFSDLHIEELPPEFQGPDYKFPIQ